MLVEVKAASMHADVWHTVFGRPYVLRLMGSGLRKPRNPIPGTDLAGVVEAVGPGVTRFAVGDPVFGEIAVGNQWRNAGCYAEYAKADEAKLEPMPGNVSFVEAAAIPTSALIALFNLRGEGGLQAGERVLVNGAAGGVGMFAVQIAKANGCHVTGVDATDRLAAMRSIGVDEAIDYTARDFTQLPSRFDVIFDVPGNRPFSAIRRVLAPNGRYVLIGHDQYGSVGRRYLGSIPTFAVLAARSLTNPQLPKPQFSGPGPDAMAQVAALVEEGWLRPLIDRAYPLERTADALRYLASGEAIGKVVITMG